MKSSVLQSAVVALCSTVLLLLIRSATYYVFASIAASFKRSNPMSTKVSIEAEVAQLWGVAAYLGVLFLALLLVKSRTGSPLIFLSAAIATTFYIVVVAFSQSQPDQWGSAFLLSMILAATDGSAAVGLAAPVILFLIVRRFQSRKAISQASR